MTHSDLDCPYCGEGLEICHDDGFGYEEGRRHEMECYKCGKSFVFTTSISFYYEPEKADCLNGEPHDMEPVISYPNCWPDWKRCKNCDHEIRGEYKEPERNP